MTQQHRELIDHVLSGNGTAEQRDEFAALVLSDDAFALAAARHAAMIAEIHERFTGTLVHTIEPTPTEPPGAPKPRGAAKRTPGFEIPDSYVYAAAALVAIATMVVGINFIDLTPDPSTPEPSSPNNPGPAVATLIENTGNLRTPHGYPAEGDDYGRGEYALASGTAEFMLTNAVNVKLRGNTRMTMHNHGLVSLDAGRAEFVVPADATGFTAQLPGDLRIVDLGTRFAIDLDPNGSGRVDVIQGRVEIHDAQGNVQIVEANEIAELELATGTFTHVRADDARRIVPAVYWSFDQDFSATLGGAAFDAVAVNEPTIDTDGRIGSAARFDRDQKQHLRIGRSVLPTASGRDHTYAAWYKLDVSDINLRDRYFLLESTPSGDRDFAWAVSYGLRDIGRGDIGQVFAAFASRDDVDVLVPEAAADESSERDGWNHIAVVYDADGGTETGHGRLTVYLNGTPAGNADVPEPLSTTDGLVIGGHRAGTGRNFDGLIDEVAFWHESLTPQQIERIYHFGVRSAIRASQQHDTNESQRRSHEPLTGELEK